MYELTDNIITSAMKHLIKINLKSPKNPIVFVKNTYPFLDDSYIPYLCRLGIAELHLYSHNYFKKRPYSDTIECYIVEIDEDLILNKSFRSLIKKSDKINKDFLKYYTNSMWDKFFIFINADTFSKPLREALKDGFSHINLHPPIKCKADFPTRTILEEYSPGKAGFGSGSKIHEY